jgi:transcriptional regulator with GAF, ATPase, and Fis domain
MSKDPLRVPSGIAKGDLKPPTVEISSLMRLAIFLCQFRLNCSEGSNQSSFERVGDDHPVSVNVRIITATNKNLLDLIARDKFREDFYFRINVIPILLPPLRERREDIPLMVDIFMQRLRSKTGKSINGIQREALDRLWKYHYPGNVRELKSILQYAFTVAEKGPLSCKHLPPQLSDALSAGKAAIYVPGLQEGEGKRRR